MTLRRVGKIAWKLFALGGGALLLVFLASAQGPAGGRITQPVDSARWSQLRGNVHPLARAEFDRGPVDGSMKLSRMAMFFKPTAAQQASLDALLAAQQDPSSPNYHRWLTPEEYAAQFGLAQPDVDRITAWLQSQGFTIDQVARGRNWVAFSGTAAQTEAAFRTEIHHYLVNGRTHFANSTTPSIPSAFSGVVMGVRGLNDFRPQPRPPKIRAAKPNFTSGISGNHFITPPDFATIYDVNAVYNAGFTGTGETIAVMGQTDIVPNDICTFRSLSGLPAPPSCDTNCEHSVTGISPVQIVLVGTADPGCQISSGDLSESDLDLEWAGGVAPGATVVFVDSANGVFDAFTYAVDNPTLTMTSGKTSVISNSYGICEPFESSTDISSVQAAAQQANAEGITIIAPGGDNGATDCDSSVPATVGLAVDFPGSLPSVTSVGGTEFNEGSGSYWKNPPAIPGPDITPGSVLSYIPEMVWNDTSNATVQQECLASQGSQCPDGGGGGSSTLFAKPIWQVGSGVPNDSARDVPDLSLAGSADHDGYLICSQEGPGSGTPSCTNGFRDSGNNLDVVGGTSMGVPTFAAILTLVEQRNSIAGLGNVNPILYALAAKVPSAFHDTTTGNNDIAFAPVCGSATVPIGYSAGPSYDLASGLGSPDVNVLVTNWTSVAPATGATTTADFQMGFSQPSLSVGPGSCASASMVVSPLNGFAGIPQFTCTTSVNLGSTSCSVTQSPVGSVGVPGELARPREFTGPGAQRYLDWRIIAGVFLIASLLWSALDRKRRLPSEPATMPWPRSGLGLSPARLAPRFALALLLAMVIGCSSTNNTPTPTNLAGSHYTVTVSVPQVMSPVTGVVTVTANIGTISHAAQFNLTIQ